MAQNITSFYRVAQVRDFARQFQFRLVRFGNTGFTEDDLVYVETASLPGRSITNQTVPYMGLPFNIPGTATYPGSTGYSVTFRCDQRYDIRNVLEQNTFQTFNDNTSTGDYNTPSDSSVLIMQLFDKDMTTISEYTLYGAYVVSVDNVNYSVSDSGSIVTMPVTIAYQFWRKTNVRRPFTVTNTRRRTR
jgi:hypothetical protein